MDNSFASLQEAHRNELATGYRYWFGQPFAATDLPNNRAVLPAAYLSSAAEGMGF